MPHPSTAVKPKVKVYAEPGTRPDVAGKLSRDLARRLERGEALPGVVVEALLDDAGALVVLAEGPIARTGSRLAYRRTGMAEAYVVWNRQVRPRIGLGQLLAARQPISACAVEITLSAFDVDPDPDGLDS